MISFQRFRLIISCQRRNLMVALNASVRELSRKTNTIGLRILND